MAAPSRQSIDYPSVKRVVEWPSDIYDLQGDIRQITVEGKPGEMVFLYEQLNKGKHGYVRMYDPEKGFPADKQIRWGFFACNFGYPEEK